MPFSTERAPSVYKRDNTLFIHTRTKQQQQHSLKVCYVYHIGAFLGEFLQSNTVPNTEIPFSFCSSRDERNLCSYPVDRLSRSPQSKTTKLKILASDKV